MNQDSLVVKICGCLETLINGKKLESSPNKCNSKDKKEALFHELKKNVHFAFEVIEKSDDLKSAVKQYTTICHKKKCKTCDYLNFLELSLVLLKLLSEALLAEENEGNSLKQDKASVPKGILSISQQKIVKKSFQFVVALGILPNLLRGIGVPLSKRLEYAKMMEHFASDITPRQKHAQIAVCVETLLTCAQRHTMQSLVFFNHGTDLLAAMFQLCHAPIKKIENKNTSEADTFKANPEIFERYFAMKLPIIKDYSSFTDHQLINEMVEDRNYFMPQLESFLKQICPSLLLWELLLFQGIPIKGNETEFTISKVPLWLRKICCQMLTELILQNHGIASFVQVVLDKAYDVDVQRGIVDNVRLDAVARLIVYNPVRHISVDDYIHRLSKQVLDLLRLKGSQMDGLLHYVASSIILHVCDRDIKSGEKHFLDTLLQPLWACVSTTSDDIVCEDKIIVLEKVLSYCIEDIHRIFVHCDSPLSRKYIQLLFPFFHCFANMYFFMYEGVSILKLKVKALLLNMLRNANEEDAISLLHAATFSTIDEKGCLIFMTTVDFAYGDEGSIGAIQRQDEDHGDPEINSRAILGLLTELNNKNLNRAFILLVLKVFCSYRTELQREPEDPKYERFQNLFSALIQELYQWDIDIREALMTNISDVIDMLNVLLVVILKLDEEDNDEAIMMVMMILNTLLFGNDELSSNDWSILKKCLPGLETLAKRPINNYIKDMVVCIITYMATHGVAGESSTFEDVMLKCITKLAQQPSESDDHEEANESPQLHKRESANKNVKEEPPTPPEFQFTGALRKFFPDGKLPTSFDETSDPSNDLKVELDKARKLQQQRKLQLEQISRDCINTNYKDEPPAPPEKSFTGATRKFSPGGKLPVSPDQTNSNSDMKSELDKRLSPEQPQTSPNLTSRESSSKNVKERTHTSQFTGALKKYFPDGKFPVSPDSDRTGDLASNLEKIMKLNRDLNKKIDELTSFEKAIQDIKDSSIPIKGHGLIAVGKLLSNRDRETLSYKKELLQIFQEGLDNDDSYVYLSAIQCLSLLADIDAELVLPTVLKLYQNPGNRNVEFILKAGEVLLKICRLLGDLVYKYRDQLLHTYLVGAKHEDSQIRSSSLSNLGEACMYLKFNISGHWVQEIIMCVLSLLKTDRDLEVRRCAVMVITLLLRGVGKDLFQIVEGQVRDIYRQLKLVYSTESDDVLRLHSQLALEEIMSIMQEHMFAEVPLTKEIQILHH